MKVLWLKKMKQQQHSISNIPEALHTRVARFLEHQGLLAEALSVTKDVEHKFDLALQLGKLQMAADIIRTHTDQSAMLGKWKQLGDVALEGGEFDLARTCFESAKDLSGLFLLHTASGDAAGLRKTAQLAVDTGKHNIAVTAYTLLQDTTAVVDTLIASGRLPEAGFFARMYCPEHVPRVLKLWKDDLKEINVQVALSLADPENRPDLFPELAGAKAASEIFAKQRQVTLGSAPCYLRAKEAVDMVTQEELAKLGPDGFAVHLNKLLTTLPEPPAAAAAPAAAPAAAEEAVA